jgi:hypothetical protein
MGEKMAVAERRVGESERLRVVVEEEMRGVVREKKGAEGEATKVTNCCLF